ncbi:MAG TPA: alpha-amylase/4-alpha-glucanotransferase domain-containing protein [Ktedonobacteraceae bacterium]|jgi:alpha-amylase|nr:alpha-amylase/4-alpha-glucanotransferase domain-containing protein [Ktedonobacteraceae bacterium]
MIGNIKSIALGLVLHNHQPVGNFPWVFQQVYEESYLPMLQALERHPQVRLSLHYTGSLLDWLEETHPAFLEQVKVLVQREQVEIVSGGYYEPILPSIPDKDKVIQIRRLTNRIQRDFGVHPTGMWIAERVWEPSLPRFIREAGIEWTILDDIHFKNVGLEDDNLYGYYATEDQSGPLKIFATSKALRYTIPWRPVFETIETLRDLATLDGERIIVMGDDCEKFGSWPETSKYCWGEDGRSGWIEEFFSALEQSSSWLHTVPLGEYAAQHAALGRIYIPSASYVEMTEWALPPHKAYVFGNLLHQLEDKKQDKLLQFMRGGFWRNFLVRYSEVNNQHKKMERIHELVCLAGGKDEHGLIQLLKAQANDTYWHGLFGGIYMTHVRSAIYHHLIKAENAADLALHGPGHWQQYTFTDFDKDTITELLIESDQQNLYIAPQQGGGIFEWDMRRSAHNVTSIMTRREESYHQTLRDFEQARRRAETEHGIMTSGDPAAQSKSTPASPHTTIRTKETGLDQYLIVDPYPRTSFIEHFLPAGLPLENFAQMRYEELGNFAHQPYETHAEQDEHGITVIMRRAGYVRRAGAMSPIPVLLTKKLFVPWGKEQLTIDYRLENQGKSRLHTTFGSEWNFNFLGGGHNQQAYYHVEGHQLEDSSFDSTGAVLQARTLHIGNTWLQQDMGVELSKPATLWRISIDTVTGSEAGFERTHQGSCLLLSWPLVLDAGDNWQVAIEFTGSLPVHSS